MPIDFEFQLAFVPLLADLRAICKGLMSFYVSSTPAVLKTAFLSCCDNDSQVYG